MPDGFLPFYKQYFVDDMVFDEDLYSYVIDEMEPDTDEEGTSDDAYSYNDIKKSFHLGHKKRRALIMSSTPIKIFSTPIIIFSTHIIISSTPIIILSTNFYQIILKNVVDIIMGVDEIYTM